MRNCMKSVMTFESSKGVCVHRHVIADACLESSSHFLPFWNIVYVLEGSEFDSRYCVHFNQHDVESTAVACKFSHS